MRGRPRKPTRLHLLEGTSQPSRLPQNEPQPEPAVPPCPEWLGPAARAEYRRVADELHHLRLIGRVDRALLVAYAQAWADFRAAVIELSEAAKLDFCLEKVERNAAAMKVKRQAVAELRGLAPHFGLSPATRAKLSVPEKPAEDLFDKLSRKPGAQKA